MNRSLTIAVCAAALFAAGCADHSDDMRTTGNDKLPDYPATHYNPAVNSDGALDGRDDPAIRPSARSATGDQIGNTGPMLNAGNGGGNGTPVGGGASDQNGVSSSPTGATAGPAAPGH